MNEQVGNMSGRTVVITGGGMGIGQAIGRICSARGATVAILDVDGGLAKAAAGELGDNSKGYECDVTDRASVERTYDIIESELNGIHMLVNNAGVTRDAMLHKLTDDEWQTVIDVHLRGTFLCTQSFARTVRAADHRGGAIVNMSSIVGKSGNLGQLNYAAAKAGIVGMTKTSARELARYEVRVNAIQPGFIDTAMTRAIPEDIRNARISEIPLARAGSVEEIARVAAFLLSDESSYMTGTVLEVTGGRRM